jgi:diacylglycerol kinase (ATP)
MAKTSATGLKRIVNATKYSMKGLKAGLINEAAFRQECCLSIIMIIASFWVAKDYIQVLLLLTGPFLVMTTEILNSAIEAVVDRIGDEYHELSGRAKDMGSAAVFIMLVYTVVVWAVILLHNYAGLF